ncbi:MAG: hypothetical protein AABZ67_00440 [Pseudomonadota bacterium]
MTDTSAPDALDQFLGEFREELKKRAGLRALVKEADERREAVLAQQALAARKRPDFGIHPGGIVPEGDPRMVLANAWKPPSLDEAKLAAKASAEYAQATARWLEQYKALEHVEATIKHMETRWETWRTRAASARQLRRMEG